MSEVVTRDKKEHAHKPPLTFGGFDSGKEIALELMRKIHTELASVKIGYICRNVAKKKNKNLVPGNVYKVSPMYKYMTGYDFILEIALEVWNDYSPEQRIALIDHLLTRIEVVENEMTGDLKYSLRSPYAQEFPEVAERHGQWHEGLVELEKSLRARM